MSYDLTSAPPLVPGSDVARLVYDIWRAPLEQPIRLAEADRPHLAAVATHLRSRAAVTLDVRADVASGDPSALTLILDAVGADFLAAAQAAKLTLESGSRYHRTVVVAPPRGELRASILFIAIDDTVTMHLRDVTRDIPLDVILAGRAAG